MSPTLARKTKLIIEKPEIDRLVSTGAYVLEPSIVRVNPRGGYQARLGGRHGQRRLRTGAGFADDHHSGDSRGPGSLEHFGPVRPEGGIGKMAVSVDQQGGSASRPSFTLRSAASGWAPAVSPCGALDVPARQGRASASRWP